MTRRGDEARWRRALSVLMLALAVCSSLYAALTGPPVDCPPALAAAVAGPPALVGLAIIALLLSRGGAAGIEAGKDSGNSP